MTVVKTHKKLRNMQAGDKFIHDGIVSCYDGLKIYDVDSGIEWAAFLILENADTEMEMIDDK